MIALQKIGDGYGEFGGSEDLSNRTGQPEAAQKLARQTLRLPLRAVQKSNINDIVEWLDDYTRANLPGWQDTVWLKGTPGIVFNENGEFIMGECTLQYDRFYGLRVKEGENE